MIVENINDCEQTDDLETLAKLYRHTKGNVNDQTWNHIQNLLSSDRLLFLHSGSWRFQHHALYLEYDYLKHYPINWHPNTKFSNHIDQLLPGLVSSFKISDVILFHPTDTRYKTPQQIQHFCDTIKNKLGTVASLHLVTSMSNICINRLCYDSNMIEKEFAVKIIGNDIVWAR